ncbi:long-chain fatty acid--CoA ligase [Methylobacterium sp. NEAU K]|uniref:AMP-dependent synthetase/ligase n=1 Tax=Methylobacterium sp. NEAU K TaxID=3064946 RepID=UPI0027370870|nr:AMP-dependent synthetase/ligase [Methylobacterium sp. NEAU K]MDP4006219.1 AMP-dependent synthetase/ligase [Methylobacterium sp. NEAU K]
MRAFPLDPVADPDRSAPSTIPELLEEQAKRRGTETAYVAYDRQARAFRPWSWSAVAARVEERRAGLAAEKLRPGERIALWLPNGLEWVCFDQAALSLGLVVVPLFLKDSRASLRAILEDSGAAFIVVQSPEDWQSLGPDAAPLLKRVVIVDAPETLLEDGRACALGDWLAAYGGRSSAPLAPDPDALATIVYTSGTTGKPKGVMLTHRNLLAVARAVLARNPGSDRDVFLSYLPLTHIFERVVGCYLPLILGARVVFARSVEHMREDLLVARPTILLVVPSLLDRLHERALAVGRRNVLGRWLLGLALARGWQVFEAARDGRPVGLLAALLWRLLYAIVSRPIFASFGGRVRLAVSGGAPLSEDTARFCLSLGFPLVEGYGLTESASAVTGFRVGATIPGCVGPPLPGIDLRIAETGEILVRSPGVMHGYWGLPDMSAQALHDGWLRTGDLGTLRDGLLFIRGRLKDGIVLSNGEKIWPDGIEAAIRQDPLFHQVMLVGDGQPRLTALAVVAPNAWQTFAQDLGLDPKADASLLASAARGAALDRIAAHMQHLLPAARVGAVSLLREPWTIERGLITPTLKLRRSAIQQQYGPEIKAMLHDLQYKRLCRR